MKEFGLTDNELFPLMNAAGHANLNKLRQHPHAPKFNWRTGDRLTSEGLADIQAYAQEVRTGPAPWPHGGLPPWVPQFVDHCRRNVPFYRSRLASIPTDAPFTSLPLTRRTDIQKEPWSFVPDSIPIDSLITYTTSGTTGTRLRIPATPTLPSRYLPLIQQTLARFNITLQPARPVSVLHVCAQRGTVLLSSVSAYLGGAGFVKINLDPADWRSPDDILPFIDQSDPELLTGDPFSFWKLSQLATKITPKALLSAGTALTPALRRTLKARFSCPVIDMYSMNESGPVGFSFEDGIHEILTPSLYIEILDPAGNPCPPGIIGQVTLTGGLNTCLPLLRYPTADFASLDFSGSVPRLKNLHARNPIAFRSTSGEWFTSLDVSTALAHLSIPHLSLSQHADGSLTLQAPCDAPTRDATLQALRSLFGASQSIHVEPPDSPLPAQKPITYRCDLTQPN
jgi:phenylacetate-CoA ligase